MNLLSYTGSRFADYPCYDGGLPHVPGVETFCVMRADREHPCLQNGDGWTYNHAPMLAYWNERFWLSFLNSPRDEHVAPCRTLLFCSHHGRQWEFAQELFPPYEDDSQRVIMHQRCGFYRAENDVFLALGFYGVVSGENGPPFGDHGLGRVVRRIHRDGTLGSVYFIRVNAHPVHQVKPQFPFYTDAEPATREACELLLNDRLKTLEWWDEELNDSAFFAHSDVASGLSAVSLFQAADGQMVGIGKWGRVVFSNDDGTTWQSGGVLRNLPTNGAKVWAQRIAPEKFALILNPTPHNERRWPLAVVTSKDGLHYDDLRCLVGEVTTQRYAGQFKDPGPQYVRGLEVGQAADDALWLTYSMNKEDIYVARVPLNNL